MSYDEPTYEYRGEWQPPAGYLSEANAVATVRKALALMARESVMDDRRDAEELLNRNDWTVYFP